MKDKAGLRLRAGIMAGLFYPESSSEAAQALSAYDEAARSLDNGNGRALAVIVPHAGWELVGTLCAAGCRAARDRNIKNAVIIGPCHEKHSNGLYLSESDKFLTPLGDVDVNSRLVSELASCGTNFIVNDMPHLEDHSIEIIVPFIQYYFPLARLVPILIGGSKQSDVRSLSLALDLVFGSAFDETLLVVSTNASNHIESDQAAVQADHFIRLALDKNSDGLLRAIADGQVGACGAAATAALLSTQLLAGGRPRLLGRQSSKAKRQPQQRQVCYAAIAYDN